MTPVLLIIAKTVLRGVLPYPDPVRRARVRRRAHDLAGRDLWPQDEAAVTELDFARLALLRLLWLQRETRRATRTRQREAAALLARTSMETCILGLWCLHNPDASSKLRTSAIKTAPAMLTFLSSAGLIPDTLIRQAVHAQGEPEKVPDVRSMAAQVDAMTSATLAIHLYDQAYRPASRYFTHATSTSLLWHVTRKRRRTVRPANSWVRRAPVRLADACVGLLAGAIAGPGQVPPTGCWTPGGLAREPVQIVLIAEPLAGRVVYAVAGGHGATTVTFEVGDQTVATLKPSSPSAEALRELEVLAEAVSDIVAIERLSGEILDPCQGPFNDRDRVRLRSGRLMWEGHIVHAMSRAVTVTTRTGNPPTVIAIEAGTLDVGGVNVGRI